MGLDTQVAREANAAVAATLDALVRDGVETGVQVAAFLDGELVVDAWSGLADPSTGAKVDGDTLFNVFSVTKAIAATALHLQAERGLIEYDAPVAQYWPEFGANGKDNATVRHALTHRLGVPQMPAGMTPERMCDWTWMAQQIAALVPIFEPGSKTAYQAMTFGWIIGELVRRTDPKQRSFNRFVEEELCAPLGITDLYLGIPDSVDARVAILNNADAGNPPPPGTSLYAAATPPQVDLVPEVFERSDVRRACIPGVRGIMNARGAARFFAMLANGGDLAGIRLLSEQRVHSFSVPRANSDEPDPVFFGYPLPISQYGYWLAAERASVAAVKSRNAICHPGAGGSIA
jgi:CubicO group peptidase (beta-lactamase class C family)